MLHQVYVSHRLYQYRSILAALLLSVCALSCATPTRSPVNLFYQLDGPVRDMKFGTTMAPIGDVNGDGSPDLLIGAPFAAEGRKKLVGAIFLFNGRNGALIRQINGRASPDTLGTAVSSVGDLDGDGIPEILAGAPNAQPGQKYGMGSAFVFSGRSGEELLRIDGWLKGHFLGVSVGGLGDVNGDNTPDFAVGATRETGERSERGLVHVFSGVDGSELYSVAGRISGDFFGRELAVIGDVDGDTIQDFCVGVEHSHPGKRILAGSIFVYSGAAGKLLYALGGEAEGARLGGAVAPAGDVNGDGIPDILAGARTLSSGYNQHTGGVYVFSGKDGSQLLRIEGPGPNYLLGRAVAGVGDVDGDEIPDLLVGATGNEAELPSASGRAFLFSGADGSQLFRFDGTVEREILGSVVSAAGDIDQNGVPEFLIAAPAARPNGLRGAGQVFVYGYRSAGSKTRKKEQTNAVAGHKQWPPVPR